MPQQHDKSHYQLASVTKWHSIIYSSMKKLHRWNLCNPKNYKEKKDHLEFIGNNRQNVIGMVGSLGGRVTRSACSQCREGPRAPGDHPPHTG